MIPEDLVGIIELGNLDIKCLIFKVSENGNSEILSTSITNSDGIHNGVIANIGKASSVIRSCISFAEKKSGVSLKKINVILEQPEFLCTKFSKHRKINGSQIQKDDIEFLLKEAKKQVMLNDDRQSIIHIFNHNYIVDGKTFIDEPIGVFADHLSHEMTFITMPKNNIKNINQTFFECDIEVERYISSTFSLAVNLLSDSELKVGSLLIDIGFKKTSLGFFKNLALIHSLTIPIGINHIIQDISKVCSLSMEESEVIKNKIDYSLENNSELFTEEDFLRSNFFNESVFRKISKSLILNVVNARLDEILEKIKKQISLTRFSLSLDNYFFITGGGSKLINLETYCSKFFGTQIKRVKTKNDLNEKFSSCLGAFKLIKDGWETEAIPKLESYKSKKMSFLAKIFGIRL